MPVSKKTYIILIAAVVVLSLLSSFFGYSYKKEIKENTTLKTENTSLKTQLSSRYSFTVTKIPMSVDGKIVYKTITKYTKKTSSSSESSHSASVSIVTKEVKIVKKDFAMFGIGTNRDKDLLFSAQRNVIDTPIGSFGLQINPNVNHLKETTGFVTYKP